MEYTHYWRGAPGIDPLSYEEALADVQKILDASPVPLEWGSDEDVVWANGTNGGDYETFVLPKDGLPDFTFCKTARRPYDVVVTACLAALKDRLGPDIEVKSDGDAEEWAEGVELAIQVLGREIANPIPERGEQ